MFDSFHYRFCRTPRPVNSEFLFHRAAKKRLTTEAQRPQRKERLSEWGENNGSWYDARQGFLRLPSVPSVSLW